MKNKTETIQVIQLTSSHTFSHVWGRLHAFLFNSADWFHCAIQSVDSAQFEEWATEGFDRTGAPNGLF